MVWIKAHLLQFVFAFFLGRFAIRMFGRIWPEGLISDPWTIGALFGALTGAAIAASFCMIVKLPVQPMYIAAQAGLFAGLNLIAIFGMLSIDPRSALVFIPLSFILGAVLTARFFPNVSTDIADTTDETVS